MCIRTPRSLFSGYHLITSHACAQGIEKQKSGTHHVPLLYIEDKMKKMKNTYLQLLYYKEDISE